MAAITDAFTDTNGTLLEAHVSPGGQTYTNRNAIALHIQSNHIESGVGASTSAVYEWNIGTLSDDLTWSMDYKMPLASPDDFFFSLTLRGTSAAGPTFAGFIAIVGRASGVLQLKINVDAGNVANVLVPEVDDGLTHTLTFKAQGALLRLYVDGVLKLSAYNITHPTQGETRINVRNGAAGVPAGFLLDASSIDVAPPQPLSLNSFSDLITQVRTYTPILADVFYRLTGPHRIREGAPTAQGSTGGGTPPPITGQLWPRGQKTG